MKILLIHQAFVTEDEAGGTRHFEFARYLIRRGYRFSVIASSVSYLTGKVIPSIRGRLFAKESQDGLEIIRTWTYSSIHKSYIKRTLSFISFMIGSFLGALKVHKVDIFWGTSPPIFQALTAYAVSRLKRKPFLLEIRDLWPEFAIGMGVLRNPILIRMAKASEKFLYHHANIIVVNSPGFIPYITKHSVSKEKIKFISNGVDVSMFNVSTEKADKVKRELNLEDKFVVLYTGAHGPANDLGTVIDAAERLKDYSDILFLFVGDGKDRPRLMEKAKSLSLKNVVFLPAQPKQKMPEILAASDVCIAILKAIPMFTTTYPNKVFDYIAASKPTILAIDGVIREVIEKANGGIFVKPGDSDALSRAVLKYYGDRNLCAEHGRNARKFVEKNFDRKYHVRMFEQVLKEIIK